MVRVLCFVLTSNQQSVRVRTDDDAIGQTSDLIGFASARGFVRDLRVLKFRDLHGTIARNRQRKDGMLFGRTQIQQVLKYTLIEIIYYR